MNLVCNSLITMKPYGNAVLKRNNVPHLRALPKDTFEKSSTGNVSFTGKKEAQKVDLTEMDSVIEDILAGRIKRDAKIEQYQHDLKRVKEIARPYVEEKYFECFEQNFNWYDYVFPKTGDLSGNDREFLKDFLKTHDERLIINEESDDIKLVSRALSCVRNKNRSIVHVGYIFNLIQNSNEYTNEQFNSQEARRRFEEETSVGMTEEEILAVGWLLNSTGEIGINPVIAGNFDYSVLAKRNICALMPQRYMQDKIKYLAEFLYCDDKEFRGKLEKLKERTFLKENLISPAISFESWKTLLDLSDKEYKRVTTPIEQREPVQTDMRLYKAETEAKIKESIVYEPDKLSALIKNINDVSFYDSDIFDEIYDFKKIESRPAVKFETLPTTNSLIKELKSKGFVSVQIKDKGGALPQKEETAEIKDREELNKEKNSRIKIDYGKEIDWNEAKIARDILQNFYDGNGYTLEGTDIEVQKTGKNQYKVKITGQALYDYSHIKKLGYTTKKGDSNVAGSFGEGTRIVAVKLLSDLKNTTYVKYSSGDWTMNFTRSKDNEDLMQTLTENKERLDGNYIEFDTKDLKLVKKIFDAKDYFYHPYNPDFHNADYENDFLSIKILPEGKKGNVYVVQRYGYNGTEEFGVDGLTIVFKKMPNDKELVLRTGQKYYLETGRDRINLSSTDLEKLLFRYLMTVDNEALCKMICSLERVWCINDDAEFPPDSEIAFLVALLRVAKLRGLGIDFESKKYFYLPQGASTESAEMMKIMGYRLCEEYMKDVGMKPYSDKDTKRPREINEKEAAKIHLLDEAVKILCEAEDTNTLDLIAKGDSSAPKYIFDESETPNKGAEAIIDGGKYKGHWIKTSHLYNQDFAGNLATWLHEISHKAGGDTTENFSERLIAIQKHIINVVIHDRSALEKMCVLASLYGEKVAEKSFTDENSYKSDVIRKINSQEEYVPYIENNSDKVVKGFLSKLKKIFSEVFDSFKKFTFSEVERKVPEKVEVLPSTDSLIENLQSQGFASVQIKDKGGCNPPKKEKAKIKDRAKLNKKEDSCITISYGLNTKWSNIKIARDILQNFYDGNGHTLEGTDIEVQKTGEKYKIKITGQALYDYSHLEALGATTKKRDKNAAGSFGEGTRITAVTLLSKLDTSYVKYSSGDWTMNFERKNLEDPTMPILTEEDLPNAEMTQTLTENKERLNGNYIEFETGDIELVKKIFDAKDYFYHPYNPDFKNLDFENDYLAFGLRPDNGNLYYIQRYEAPGGKIDETVRNLSIIFKKNFKKEGFSIGTDRDRIAINSEKLRKLARISAKKLTDEELLHCLEILKPVFTTTDLNSSFLDENTTDMAVNFVFGLLNEASRRKFNIDFTDSKIVCVSSRKSHFDIRLNPKFRKYFLANDYVFAPEKFIKIGMRRAEDVYAELHRKHSSAPNSVEAKKLKILEIAVDLFRRNKKTKLPKNPNARFYVYNAQCYENEPYHKLRKNGLYDGLFIDKEALREKDFTEILSEVLSNIIEGSDNMKAATYSYDLTEQIESDIDLFIKNPETAQKLKVLKDIYNQMPQQ